MDEIELTRKKRLANLIAQRFAGVQKDFASAAGLSEGRVTQLLSPRETFGERSARKIVERLGLSPRYFDQEDRSSANAPPAVPRDFKDRREVSPSDWGLLQDVMLVMTDEERSAIRDRAERTRRIAAEQLAEVSEMSAPQSPMRRLSDKLPGNLGAPIQTDYDRPERRKQGGQ